MKQAEITDPLSQEGIKFCVNQCPYECCVAVEASSPKRFKIAEKAKLVRKLLQQGKSIRQIAIELRITESTVNRYNSYDGP